MSQPLDSCEHLARFQVQGVWLTKPCCWALKPMLCFPQSCPSVACPSPDLASMQTEAGPLLRDKASPDGCL